MSLLGLTVSPANDNENLGFVYFMWVKTDRISVKIGVAKDPEARRRCLQIGNPDPIHLGLCLDVARFGVNPYTYEKAAHEFFAPYKLQGEWFDFPSDCPKPSPDKLVWAYFRYPYLYDAWQRRLSQKPAAKEGG